MNPLLWGHIKGKLSAQIRAKRAGTPVAAGYRLRRAALFEQAGCRCLYVDAARVPELFHALHLRAGDVHVIAAVNYALGQQQIRIACDEGLSNLSFIQRTQQLLGSDNPSVNVGKSLMHKQDFLSSSSAHTIP